jgi:hypothetical protein
MGRFALRTEIRIRRNNQDVYLLRDITDPGGSWADVIFNCGV